MATVEISSLSSGKLCRNVIFEGVLMDIVTEEIEVTTHKTFIAEGNCDDMACWEHGDDIIRLSSARENITSIQQILVDYITWKTL